MLQLQEARASFDIAKKVSQDHSNQLRSQGRQFQTHQADIDLGLKIITQSETSDDAVIQFNLLMESLQRLDVAQGYMTLLSEIEHFRFL